MKIPHVSAPPSRFASFYDDPTFADVFVVLRATSAGHHDHAATSSYSFQSRSASQAALNDGQRNGARGGRQDADTATGAPDSTCGAAQAGQRFDGKLCDCSLRTEEIRVHAHSVILASSSEMMRCWLTRWSESEADEAEEGQRGSPGRPGRRQRRTALRLELELAPGELAAGEAVLRFMYTQALEGVDDDEQLLACMLLADRWLLPDCAAACAARLASTPAGSLHWRVRAALLALPPGLAAACPAVAALQARAEAALMRSFRCPELMWEEPDNRRLLLSLPAGRLAQLLLSRDDLQVSSENVLLSLLSEWMQHQTPEQQLGRGEEGGGDEEGERAPCAACGRPAGGATAAAVTAQTDGAQEAQERNGAPACTAAHDAAGAGDGLVRGPAEVEGLLRHVRYCRLGAHFRDQVAPRLPGLRRLRLHHELLAQAAQVAQAEARAAAAAEKEAVTAPADPAPPAAPAAASSCHNVVHATPDTRAECEPSTASHKAACACAEALSADAASLAQSHGSAGCPVAHGSGACAPPVPTPPATPGEISRASSACAAELALLAPSACGGGGGGGGTATPAPSQQQCVPDIVCIGGAQTGGNEPVAEPQSNSAHADVAAGVAAVAAAALAREASPAASPAGSGALAAPAAPAAPRPPPRQPYNVLRRIEWCRDVRDVRIHLTGVGGPMQGGEARTSHHLSPPVFLGGYNWHVATRFAPAAAASAPAAAPGGAPLPGLLAPPPPPGRLQLQLGIICTAPAAAAATAPLPAGAAAAAVPLSVASCTLGVLDGSSRPAWQLAAAPCVLAPATEAAGGGAWARRSVAGAGAAEEGVEGARVCGGGGMRWEYWSGLVGLEPTWWESGSAITSGGVVRLYCLLQM